MPWRTVLISDGGRDAVAKLRTSDRTVARAVFEFLLDRLPSQDVFDAALADSDPVSRRQAVRRLAAIEGPSATAQRLARLATTDRAPSVRLEALTLLERCDPARALTLLPHALLDRSASVRGLARFLASKPDSSLDARALYLERFDRDAPSSLNTAVLGLGECGTKVDADRVQPLLSAGVPHLRGAALQATANLDLDRALPFATEALEDPSGSVRSAALRILRRQAYRVDFAALAKRMPDVVDPRARKGFLRLLAEAPKWDAAVFLLAALGDRERDVRDYASELLAAWVALSYRRHTAPTPAHLQQIRVLLETYGAALSTDTAGFLRSLALEH